MAPQVADAVALGRVQGIASDISDLKLRDGRDLTVALGGAITSPPTLTRTIDGSSSIELPVFDPELKLLDAALLAEKFDAKIDGLWFRYIGASKAGKTITLTFEDRDVARLRELKGPKKAFRAQMTRAEFIIGLVEEAKPAIPFFCPQLREKQPIKTEKRAKQAVAESKANRSKGIGNTKGLKLKGQTPTPGQEDLAEMALQIADSVGAPFRVQVALMAALIDETDMGLVQRGNVLAALEPYTQVRNAAEEISGFLTGEPTWTGVTAIGYFKENPGAAPHTIAQAVQKSATSDGSNYAAFENEAREWVEAFGGATEGELSGGSEEVTEPYTFEVKKKETYWAAIQRLAKEVNWRAFMVAGRFFFIDEIELLRGQVRLAIGRHSEGIEDVDFDFHTNKPITEATVIARTVKWGVPPGAVATLAGYGPASIGSGDAPPKRGTKEGVSSAVNASTHEGKGRFLVSKIVVPLLGRSESRLATVTLRKPTAPLKEPAAKTKTVSTPSAGASGSAGGNATTERMLTALEAAAAKKRPYVWGGEDPNVGVDCSGAVSFALRVGGFMEGRTDTRGLASFGEAGPGELITVHDHANTGDPHTEHTAIEVDGRVFESGGGSENDNPNGGLGEVTSGIAGFLAQFEIKRHPKGF